MQLGREAGGKQTLLGQVPFRPHLCRGQVRRVCSLQARLGQMGVDPLGNTPSQFSETLQADIVVWAEAAKASNLKIE